MSTQAQYPQQHQAWRPPQPPPLAPSGHLLAGFGDRLLAFLIDIAIYIAVFVVVFIPLAFAWIFFMISQMEGGGEPNVGLILALYFAIFGVAILLSLGFTYLYFVEYQLRKGGQTVGKRVMKLWVMPVTPTEQLTRGHLVRRWAIQHVVAAIVPAFSYVDGLWQLWDKPLQQCLHDKAAATVVVKVG